mgnify:FL=1
MKNNTLPEKTSKQAKNSPLDQQTTYQINGRSFIVQPVFKENGTNTLGSVLLRLMQADCEKSI